MTHQRFVGIRSGWTGEGVIVFPVFQTVRGMGFKELMLCGNILGHVRSCGSSSHPVYMPVAYLNGEHIELDTDISALDAALNIMQYLSDRKDTRMECIHG